jgi:2-polyprenyl-6-methoxyphenol hydroxylase-like FAD-dependent oxidoreductase
LREFAASFPTVTVRLRTRFESFAERDDGVIATVTELATGERHDIGADYLVACCGGGSPIAKALGIAMSGTPTLEYNLNIFFRVPELWKYHDKGKASLHFFVDAQGIWRTLVQLDGRELWRLGIRGQWHYENPDKVDAGAMIAEAVGREIPHSVVSSLPWVARDLVADSYGRGRVFLAGDAAHQNTPSGGFGMNTGLGDAADLGWKLAALVQGWGGPRLVESYEAERRPVAVRIVKQATGNFMRDRQRKSHPEIAFDTPAGAQARKKMGEAILQSQAKVYVTDGTALGQVYDGSPIVCDDGTPPAPASVMEYRPTTRPGARAPHAWLPDGRSMLDLYGRGFTLVRLGDGPPDTSIFEAGFAARGVPLSVATIDEPKIGELYERRLVVVRPDGHVAWRGEAPPADPLAVVDRIRGAQ